MCALSVRRKFYFDCREVEGFLNPCLLPNHHVETVWKVRFKLESKNHGRSYLSLWLHRPGEYQSWPRRVPLYARPRTRNVLALGAGLEEAERRIGTFREPVDFVSANSEKSSLAWPCDTRWNSLGRGRGAR